MFELHSWLTIRETYKNEDELDNNTFIESVKKIILEFSNNEISLKTKNGICYIEFSIFSNRKTVEFDNLIILYHKIIHIAKGSYGIIYLWDDEDFNGKDNEFQLFIIKKGKMYEEKDRYLSPCIPIIESE